MTEKRRTSLEEEGDAHTPAEVLTLQEAADRLKVHYMTAYRWVRRGQLPAFKAGGRLRVREGDLAAFVDAGEVDVMSPTEGRRTDWSVHLLRLHSLLRDGASTESAALVRKVIADGATAGDVYLKLLTPALRRIGDDWRSGRISVAEEHRATEISLTLVARMGDHFRRRGPHRGTAVTLTPPAERHGIGILMVADFLRGSGFDVHHLGADVPVADLAQFLPTVPADVVCLSVSGQGLDRSSLAAVVDTIDAVGALAVLGGAGVDDALAAALGALHVADLEQLVPTLELALRG